MTPGLTSVPAKKKTEFVPFSDKLTKSLQDVSKTINDNKETMDTIQELGIELTRAISAISISALKYANMVNNILDTILPIVEKLPILPPRIKEVLKDLNIFADKFLASVQTAQKVSGNVEHGLIAGDVNTLKTQSADLKKVVASVKAIIPDKE